MKPTNTRPDLLLSDGEPVRCYFMAKADAPVFWEYCETHATEKLAAGERIRFDQWTWENPKAIIRLYPTSCNGSTYLCDTHLDTVRECL
jgi:hypothetical protein